MAGPGGIQKERGNLFLWFLQYFARLVSSRVGAELLELDLALQMYMLQSNKRHNFVVDTRIMNYKSGYPEAGTL